MSHWLLRTAIVAVLPSMALAGIYGSGLYNGANSQLYSGTSLYGGSGYGSLGGGNYGSPYSSAQLLSPYGGSGYGGGYNYSPCPSYALQSYSSSYSSGVVGCGGYGNGYGGGYGGYGGNSYGNSYHSSSCYPICGGDYGTGYGLSTYAGSPFGAGQSYGLPRRAPTRDERLQSMDDESSVEKKLEA